MTAQYVVVTYYAPHPDKRPVVHAWGPYPTRSQAATAKARMRRRVVRDYGAARATEVGYHVCGILP